MDIEKLAENYKLDKNSIEVAKSSRLLFLIGVVSAGKDTIKQELSKKNDYCQLITYTTRPPRLNNGKLEQDGKDHYFVSFDKMAELLDSHQLIEVNHFGVNYYGTGINELIMANDTSKIVLADVDINGVSAFHKIAPDNMLAIFVVPPDYDTWLQRIESRYESMDAFNDEWKVRKNITISELETALQTPYFHFVINDNLKDVVEYINKIAHHNEEIIRLNDTDARNCAQRLLEKIKLGF